MANQYADYSMQTHWLQHDTCIIRHTVSTDVMRCGLIARALTVAALLSTRKPLTPRVGVTMAAGQAFSRGLKVSDRACVLYTNKRRVVGVRTAAL